MILRKYVNYYNEFGNGNCARCGKYCTLTIDHFIPKSCGMKVNESGNYVGLCYECNQLKGNKIVTPDWYKYIGEQKKKNLDRYMRYAASYIRTHTEDKYVLQYLDNLINKNEF